MPTITLTTYINAPVEKVFDLARSIDLHQQSMQHTKEKAISGRTSGLIEEGETVTWQARHLFKTRRLTSRITSMKVPFYFKDIMIKGDFKLLEHDHYFNPMPGGTEMKDVFRFLLPFGFLGTCIGKLFLTRYLQQLLQKRNMIIKNEAEAC